MKSYPVFFVAIVCVLGLAGCDSTEDTPVSLNVITVTDLPADPATGRDPNTGQPIGTTGQFTFYSLRETSVVLSHTEANRADSASTQWDVAFHGTTIMLNGNNDWGGQGGALILDESFGGVIEAPVSGYSADPIGLQGNPRTWFVYQPAAMIVLPGAPQTLVVRTADGRYAKMSIKSYYKGAPDAPNAFADQDRYYTFDYIFQPDGSRSF